MMAGVASRSSSSNLNIAPERRYQIVATDSRAFSALLSIFFNIPLVVTVIYALVIVIVIILAVLTTGRTFLISRAADAWIFLPLLAGVIHIVLTLAMFAAVNPRRSFGTLKVSAESFDTRSAETMRNINVARGMALAFILLSLVVIGFSILLNLDLFAILNLSSGTALPLGPFTTGQSVDSTFDCGIVITSWVMIAVELFLVLFPFAIARISTLGRASKSAFGDEPFYVRVSTSDAGSSVNLFVFQGDAETFDRTHSIVTEYSGQRFGGGGRMQPTFESPSMSNAASSAPYQSQQQQQQQLPFAMSMQNFTPSTVEQQHQYSYQQPASSSTLQGLVKRSSASLSSPSSSQPELQQSQASSTNELQIFDSYSSSTATLPPPPSQSTRRSGMNFAAVADSMLDV